MRHQLRSKKLWKLVKGEEILAEGAEQPAVDSFEERCVDATMRLTHAMSPHCCVACAGIRLPCENMEPAGEAI